MQASLYDFTDYKRYLLNALNSTRFAKRGGRMILAEAAQCQPAFVSQVLNARAHFSLEQADGISRYLAHNAAEREFFLLMVQYARAGTKPLKDFFHDQIRERARKALQIKEKVEPASLKLLTPEQLTIYYSSWRYAAIHVLVGVPGVHTPEAIARYLGLPTNLVREVLVFLELTGLLKKVGDIYKPGKSAIHLGSDSPLISRHHSNWRLRAIDQAEIHSEHALQYSSVVTISQNDAQKIRAELTELIVESKQVIRASRDEKLYCFNVDLFELSHRSGENNA